MEFTTNSASFRDAVVALGYSYWVGGRRVADIINHESYNFYMKKDEFNFQLPNAIVVSNNHTEYIKLTDLEWEQLFSAAILNEGLEKEPDETNLDFAKRIIKEMNFISMKWQSCAIL